VKNFQPSKREEDNLATENRREGIAERDVKRSRRYNELRGGVLKLREGD